MIWFLFWTLLITSATWSNEVPSLPHCTGNLDYGLVIVSTLDGKLSALNQNGSLIWEIDTGPGPLLHSNIHALELTDKGEWIRIIPSLTGTLYKFDGLNIDPIPISTEDLLKSSFLYSTDLVIAGGIDVRTYGVGFRTGTLFYECNTLSCSSNGNNDDEVLLVERSTRTIRAVEPRTGVEKWNFSVGMHNIKLPMVTCLNKNNNYKWNFTIVIPEGQLSVSINSNNKEKYTWHHMFPSPIVRMWKWTGETLDEVNIFNLHHTLQLVGSTVPPSIYIGMHMRQLYIYESVSMQKQVENFLSGQVDPNAPVTETTGIVKIPWKPIPASKVTARASEQDSTAIAVLNGSEYVNGHGYYLHFEKPVVNTVLCGNDSFIKNYTHENLKLVSGGISFLFAWWLELLLLLFTLVICNILFRYWHRQLHRHREVIIIEKPIEAQISIPQNSQPDKKENFVSRFENDFETMRCLGKGGFGVVFEVKQKIDECSYAIKRITLPNDLKSRDRVMREVKALAKLEHQNIVRYFCSWVENPPVGWQQDHDKQWINERSFDQFEDSTEPKAKRTKSMSVSINIPLNSIDSGISKQLDDDDDDDDDSFIVFENNSEVAEAKRECSESKSSVAVSEHQNKKINWKRPDRRHYSWDLSLSNANFKLHQKNSPVYLYIQMQLCQKESLKDWLNAHLNRDHKVILNFFLQILEAVEYVHLRGLIHRDLKPSNIFFSLDGQIKVGDFGLVKDVEDAIDLELIKHGASPAYRGHTLEVGTQLYMSPEQFSSRIYDYKVDIYSLGLIFFELLVPFSTEMERIKMLTNVKKNIFPPNFESKFPHEYNLLQKMLCEDPNERLTTIGIKAKPPFNIDSEIYGEDYHYRLNSFIKS